ncbi:MAG: PQQ-binding-like beta-propeller repeat protein [Pirellulaceae bacterium]|nr:PQQ-binding-like beta-propeller repeat protein [Pirellulaceae bacterium]
MAFQRNQWSSLSYLHRDFVMTLGSPKLNALPIIVRAICVSAVWGAILLSEAVAWQQPNATPQELMEVGQLFVPAPRELARPLLRAEKAIREEDYRTAVDLLGEILATPSQGDFLQPIEGEPYRAISIHNQAHRLLSQIAPQFRADYELRYKVAARQMLEKAVSEADYELMAQVARRYFFTASGHQATLMLGQHHLEMGQPVSAASCFADLLGDAQARQQYDPEVSIMLATCKLLTGNETDAQSILEELAALRPNAKVRLPSGEVPLFKEADDAVPWLIRLIGNGDLVGYRSIGEWAMFRGDAERNAASGSGFPLAYPNWFVPTINEPQLESIANDVFQRRLSASESLIPSLQPLAVGNTVVVRSLDNMIGIDVRSGKRIWAFPAWDRNSLMKESRSRQAREDKIERDHIEQRLWQDHLYGQIASNGQYVFVIDKPGYATSINQQSIVGRGVPIDNPLGGRSTNELKAIDLAREGAFCWEVGGRTGGVVEELAGCFFLGAPLVLENELYILGELGGEIRLIVLEQETGELVWSQQIAAIDSAPPVTEDRRRRLAGSTPSCSNGIVVCPTSATGIVAVDRTTHSLLWGVQYPGVMSGMPRMRNRPVSAKKRSRSTDASITIADGRVIVMPLELNRVLCFDLLTGEPLWHEGQDKTAARVGVPSEDGLYIACVFDGLVVVLGQEKIAGLDLDSGESVWQIPLDRLGRPTGRGFLSGDQYFFPTSESKMVAIDLRQGAIAQTITTRRVLGNLICYKNELISQGYDVVSIYPQAAPIRQFVAREMQKGESGTATLPADVLVLQAQLLAQDGDMRQAVAIADLAFQQSGERREKRLLMDLVLELMELDYPAVRLVADKYTGELREYNARRFEAAKIAGLLQESSLAEALTEYKASTLNASEGKTAASPDPVNYRNVDNNGLRMRLDAWLQKQLKDSLGKMQAGDVETQFTAWLEENLPGMQPTEMVPLVEWIGTRYLPYDQLIRLASYFIEQGDFLHAERLLDSIPARFSDASPASQEAVAQRNAFMLRMVREAGWRDQVKQYLTALQDTPETISFLDSWTGEATNAKDFLSRHRIESELDSSGKNWNYGPVDGQMVPLAGSHLFLIRSLAWPELVGTSGDVPEDLSLEVNFQDSTLVIRDDRGAILEELPYRENPDSRSYYSPNMYNGTFTIHGHLLVFAYGYDLIGVDLNQVRAGKPALLWQKNLKKRRGVDNRLQLPTAHQHRSINQPWGPPRFILHERDEGSNPIGNFASNASHVFFRLGKTIQCVDALTGELVWQRTNLNPTGWLVADEQYVALLNRQKSSAAAQYDSATVMSAATGAIVKTVDLSAYTGKVLWHNLGLKLVMSGQNREPSLALFDLVSEQETWAREWPGRTRAVIRDPRTMVFLLPSGQVQYVDLRSGETQSQIELGGDAPSRTFRLMKLKEQDLLLLGIADATMVARTKDQQVSIRAAVSGANPLFNGWIYSVQPETGEKTWEKPVRAQHFSIPKEHPIDTPLLTLNRVVYPGMKSSRGSDNLIELLTIDVRDGRLVNEYRMKNATLRSIQVVASREEQTVVHTFNKSKLILRVDQGDFPPAAPASLTNETTIPKSRAFAAGGANVQENRRQQQGNLIREIRGRKQDE